MNCDARDWRVRRGMRSRRTRNSTERASPQRRGIGERGEIGRAVGDMHAVEQPMAVQFARPGAEQRFGGRRNEQHRAVAAVPRDDVGHVAREQAVAVLLRVEQPEARARERFGAEREARRIERRRDDAERRKRAGFGCRSMPSGGSMFRPGRGTAAGPPPAAQRSRPAPPRGAKPTARLRAARSPARSRRTRRCRRCRRRPRSPGRSAPATTARARFRSGRCATGNRR